jgi:hypothetical protein
MKNVLITVLSILTFFSCKNEVTKIEPDELPETFEVKFNLTVPKDDVFTLYYTEDKSLNFDDKMSVKTKVIGSENPQDILFKLPVDVAPTNIRLDFGDNVANDFTNINSLNLKYYNKTFSVNFKDLQNGVNQYFYFLDTQVKYDIAESKVTFLKPQGQIYDPLMWSNDLLSEEISKILK